MTIAKPLNGPHVPATLRTAQTGAWLLQLTIIGSSILALNACDETVVRDGSVGAWSAELKKRLAWAAAWERAYCEYVMRCPDSPNHVTSLESCLRHELVRPIFASRAANPGFRFSAKIAKACLKAMSSKACTFHPQLGYFLPVCTAVFTGVREVGEACEDMPSLLPGSVCEDGWCSGGVADCDRRCVALTAIGGKCSAHRQCASGLCVEKHCVDDQPIELGKPCGDVRQAYRWPCVEGAECNAFGPDYSSGTCVKRPGIGEKCTVLAYQCSDGTICVPPGPALTSYGTCRPKVDVGQSCRRFWDMSDCAVGAVCISSAVTLDVVDGICMALSNPGEVCHGSKQCRGLDTFCDGVAAGAGVCSFLPGEGEPCVERDPNAYKYGEGRCNGGLRCHEGSGKCAKPWPSDMFATPCPSGCLEGENCIWGKCVAAPGLGHLCLDPPAGSGASVNRCAGNLRCSDTNGVCQPLCP